jgi:hypothetical protein
MIAQCSQEQRECGQALLSVDQQPARKPRQAVTGGDINNRAEEVAGFSARASSAKYVTPKLGALRLCLPRIIALENRDHELGRSINDAGEGAIYGFHGKTS